MIFQILLLQLHIAVTVLIVSKKGLKSHQKEGSTRKNGKLSTKARYITKENKWKSVVCDGAK